MNELNWFAELKTCKKLKSIGNDVIDLSLSALVLDTKNEFSVNKVWQICQRGGGTGVSKMIISRITEHVRKNVSRTCYNVSTKMKKTD